MNKLLDLLNEREEEEKTSKIKWKIDYNPVGIYGYVWDYWLWFASKMIIISKEYWFIQRLIKKDRIDFDKCWLDIKQYLSYNKRYNKWIVMAENYDYDTFKVREFYSPYEQLLMILAIQDEPIEYLISVLK